jgi:hypothetical protein
MSNQLSENTDGFNQLANGVAENRNSASTAQDCGLTADTQNDGTANTNKNEPEKYEYLVKEMLPSGRVSLLVGPSGAGKTTLALQLAESWVAGEPFLDKDTYRPRVHVAPDCRKYKHCKQAEHFVPATFFYIAADRGEQDTEETLDRVLGADSPLLADKDGFQWQSVLKGRNGMRLSVDECFEKAGASTKILFIEGAACFVESGRVSDNGSVAEFLKHISSVAQERNIAVLLSMHSPKMKEREEYKNPRQRILGAVAWGAYSSTIMVLTEDTPQDVAETRRTFLVLPRNYRGRKYSFTMNAKGRFVEAPTPETAVQRVSLLGAMDSGRWYSRQQLVATGTQLGISERTVDRLLRGFVDDGKVFKRQSAANFREREFMRPPLDGVVAPEQGGAGAGANAAGV